MTHDPNRRSTLELLSDAVNDATALVGSEAKLLKAEMSHKVDRAVTAIGLMVIAAVFFIGALFLLLQTGVAFLVQWGLSPAVSSILMAVVSGIVGLGLFFAGKNALSADKLTPNRSLEQITRDVAVAKHAVGGSPTSGHAPRPH
ncbi:MAG: phage holin family protein [Beijerinckiaceae bacterium]|nr:phage holin family protein [Beijerinckiaceae bacterium]